MKKYLFVLLVAACAASCVSRGKAVRLEDQKDSLAMVVAEKDSIINDIFGALNTIDENLTSIRDREHLVTAGMQRSEIGKQDAARISEDIAQIGQLLESNRQTIERLQKSADKLRKANVRIASLEKMIARLNEELTSRDAGLDSLRGELEQRNIQITTLRQEVAVRSDSIAALGETQRRLEGEVRTQADLLNTAYYIVGSQKELLADKIVYKSGFIGRTLKINENRSLDTFTRVDIRHFTGVQIGQKGAQLVSSHPEGSYDMVKDENNVYKELRILDPEKFWEYSKVLVIAYK